MVSATPKFIEGEKVVIDAVGGVDHVAAPSSEIQLLRPKKTACLCSYVSFQISIKSSPAQILVDRRSGAPVNLQHCISTDLKASVHYGKSLKQLREAYIHVNRDNSVRFLRSGIAQTQPMSHDGTYEVRIQPIVCGGKHIITLRFGYGVLKHTFTVTGEPQDGALVTMGPDWKHEDRGIPTGKNGKNKHAKIKKPEERGIPSAKRRRNDIGTVCCQNQHNMFGSGSQQMYHRFCTADNAVPIGEKDMLTVKEHSGTIRQYKWGKDGEYEIELCNIMTL